MDYIIAEDGTIVWGHSEKQHTKEKIEKIKQRLGSQTCQLQLSPNDLLDEARRLYYDCSDKEDEAMSLFYRPDVQSIMSANDCFSAGLYMFNKKRDSSEARKWYYRAVERGDVDAKLRLAWMYRVGEGGLPEDSVSALEIYAEEAKKGHFKAEEEMGNIYMNGDLGVSVNYSVAEEMYTRSAHHGNKFISSRLKDVEKMKLLNRLSHKQFLMQIDNVTSSNRGTRVTGKVSEGIAQVGDCVAVVGKNRHIKTVVIEWEVFNKIYKEAHGHFVFPGDSVRLLLRGLDSKDVHIGDWLKAPNKN